MMKQKPFPEARKKREEGRQASEPQPETGGTREIHDGTDQNPFLTKTRREKKGDKHRNPHQKKEEPGKSMMNRTLFLRQERKREEGRQAPEPQPEPGGTQQIMMEQNPCPEERQKREEGRQAREPNKRQKGRQAPEPQPEPGGTSKS